ncbi:hypothetical protein SDC9_76543 [bioreactor metagenome]|uniref:Uncharacterized protein n=1 Tax=bioreactor metagenome TaxID=1076179 RepID=A0A644YQ54_9ZZZZ
MYKYGSKTEYVNLSFYSAMLFTDEYGSDELKKMMENSRSHHLVNVRWFEELLESL